VDGGYFENYGIETGFEALLVAWETLKARKPSPVLIEISSDPSLGQRDLNRYCEFGRHCLGLPPPSDAVERDQRLRDGQSGSIPQLAAPVDAIMNARQARGVTAAQRVSWQLASLYVDSAIPPVLIQFALCRQGNDFSRPPLGWSLARATREAIRADVVALFSDTEAPDECRMRNRAAMAQLRGILGSGPRRAESTLGARLSAN
jgi:hypothetical protein